MDFVIESFRADWLLLLSYTPRLLYALVLLIVFLGAGRFAARLVSGISGRSDFFHGNERFIGQGISWLAGSVGVLLALGVLGFHGVAASMLATGGVAAIVLGFAFREIGENFLAGFFLTFSRPFELGDLIRTGELTGVVRAIEMRHVHIRAADACDVFVPSAQIFREPLFNYTRDGLRRFGLTVGLSYQDAPGGIRALLEETARGVVDVTSKPPPLATVREFSAQYVLYELFFWIDASTSRRELVPICEDVKAKCWLALRDAGLTFSADVTMSLDVQNVPELVVAAS